ncbi:MAG: extracellular solute-binding protein [Paenibacillaceae bacterium]|nr:extracellular solute-binding protein [Paenibacillaceae bacterium]
MKGRPAQKGFVMLTAMSLLLTGALAACSKSDSGKSAGSASPAASAAPTASAAPATPKERPKVSLLLSHANSAYIKGITNMNDNPYVKELNRLSGFDLQYEFLGHVPDFIPQLTTRFASGNLADLMRTDGIETAAAPGALEAGAFLELGPLIDKYAPSLKKLIPQSTWDSPKVSKNGKIYGIPTMIQPIASRVMYVRQDWLDKLNMKAPSTLDEWMAYFEAVKKLDKNAIPFAVRENMGYSEAFFGAYGVFPSDWTLANGKYIPNMIRPEMKDAIKFWKTMYDKGYVNSDMFTTKGVDWSAMITQGKVGSWMYDAQSYTNAMVNKLIDKSVKMTMIPGPVGPKGDKGLFPKSDGIYFVFVIPTKTKNPENALKFLEWAWTNEDAQKFWAYGIKDVNYKETNGKIEWDPENPRNKENNEYTAYQISFNPMGVGSSADRVLQLDPNYDTIKKGIQTADASAISTPSINMPVLSPFKTNPELVPGFGAGTLFLDMFAKVVTGKEDLDKAFDAFVADWTKRGGDKAIAEATEWYNKNVKK